MKAWLSRWRTWWRRKRWRRPEFSLLVRVWNAEHLFYPSAPVGFGLIGKSGDKQMVVHMAQCADRAAFLRTWYALGGQVARDDDGFVYDPESH